MYIHTDTHTCMCTRMHVNTCIPIDNKHNEQQQSLQQLRQASHDSTGSHGLG